MMVRVIIAVMNTTYLSSNENKVHNTGNWHLKAMEIQQSFTCISYSLPEELGGIVVTDGVEFVVT